ncbi:hypothetical protein [Amycolatopsis rhizosphaerae]|uniref:hypothetical protein n=1 Tax=Amycolatopsis rhizosphaerae TaxID=2053003 RepID=UPI00164370EB|nr:hypothetical protein [Amycolatopsis rhizosphaerae]
MPADFPPRLNAGPAADGKPGTNLAPTRRGLTFHGLRHSHKTWLIADDIPEIAQARRLGHRIIETYSHVAPELEHQLLTALETRWQTATHHDPPPAPTSPDQRLTNSRGYALQQSSREQRTHGCGDR